MNDQHHFQKLRHNFETFICCLIFSKINATTKIAIMYMLKIPRYPAGNPRHTPKTKAPYQETSETDEPSQKGILRTCNKTALIKIIKVMIIFDQVLALYRRSSNPSSRPCRRKAKPEITKITKPIRKTV